jgi:stage IV sporulation protein B
LWKLLFGGIAFTLIYSYICIRNTIPDEINLVAGSEQELDLNLPFHVDGEIQVSAVEASGGREEALQENLHLNLGNACKVLTGESGNYQMRCSLLGIFHLKDVDINVIQQKN